MFAGFRFVAAQRELETHLVGDDVALCAAVDAADGHHRRITWLHLATDDGLQGQHDLRSEHDGVFAKVRHGTVAANALHDDLDAIDIR